MAWLEQMQRHMDFLESELPMPFDEDFKFRYYNIAERKALEGIIVPYHNLASALDYSKTMDTMWKKRHGNAKEYGEDILQDEELIKFLEHVHGQFLEGVRKKVRITKRDTEPQHHATFQKGARTCTLEEHVEAMSRGPEQEPEHEPNKDLNGDTIDMEDTIVVETPADRRKNKVHRRKQG